MVLTHGFAPLLSVCCQLLHPDPGSRPSRTACNRRLPGIHQHGNVRELHWNETTQGGSPWCHRLPRGSVWTREGQERHLLKAKLQCRDRTKGCRDNRNGMVNLNPTPKLIKLNSRRLIAILNLFYFNSLHGAYSGEVLATSYRSPPCIVETCIELN